MATLREDLRDAIWKVDGLLQRVQTEYPGSASRKEALLGDLEDVRAELEEFGYSLCLDDGQKPAPVARMPLPRETL